MSKIKIIDLNKKLKSRSKETVGKMEALQQSVQGHLATLKRIEADLMQIARAEAEEKKLKQEREAFAAEQEARVAQEKVEFEQAKQDKAEQEKAEKSDAKKIEAAKKRKNIRQNGVKL